MKAAPTWCLWSRTILNAGGDLALLFKVRNSV